MKTIMWLCDKDSFINQSGKHINAHVMDQIVSFKDNYNDVITLAADSGCNEAKMARNEIADQRRNQRSPFDRIIHLDMMPYQKSEWEWWHALHDTFGDDYAFILLDQKKTTRAMAEKYNVATIDISEHRPSKDIITNMRDVRKQLAQSLTA